MRLDYRTILAKRNKARDDIDELNKIKNQVNLSKNQIAGIENLIKKKKFTFNYWNNMLKEGEENEK